MNLRHCIMSIYPNAHAKVDNWISENQFPENWFEFGIVWNDFWSSAIWGIQIQVSFAAFKNHKNPEIQPNDGTQFSTLTNYLHYF